MKLTASELTLAHELWTAILAGSCAGCCFHVTLSDSNFADDFAKWEAENVDDNHPACFALAPLVLRMSRTQREKLARGGYVALARAAKGELRG